MINQLKEAGLTSFGIDLTPREVRDEIVVSRTVVPGLQPLFLDERLPYTAGPRVAKAAREARSRDGLDMPASTQRIPHFFL